MSGAAGSSQWMYATGYEIPFSVRFDGASGSYLHKTPSASASTRVWTFATWIKRSTLGGGASTHFNILGISSENDPTAGFRFQADSLAYWDYGVGGTGYALNASTLETAKFRDPSAWAHVMIAVNTTHGTDTNRLKIYWNGVLQTLDNTNQSGQGNTYPDQNADTAINASEYVTWIGASNSYGSFDGYMADTYFINNQQLTPASFGETGTYGEFKPIEYTGTFDAYSSYLDYADSGNLGDDESGNGADWAEAGIVATDQMLDTPTNNFCTMNPLSPNTSGLTFSEGNLKMAGADTGFFGTMGVSSGKWYYEMHSTNAGGNNLNTSAVGIVHEDALHDTIDSSSNDGFQLFGGTNKARGYYGYAGNKLDEDSNVSYGAAFVTGDIIGVALNLDDREITFYKNNSSQGVAFTSLGSGEWFPLWQNWTSSVGVMNFGQDSSFAGVKTAQGNQDGNGIGDFFYAPPSGFLALCTKNLPDVAVTPSEHFNTVLWTGNGSSQSISSLEFQPDFTWIKSRSIVDSHHLFDSVRGAGQRLRSDSTAAENYNETAYLTSFDSDGFSLGGDDGVNKNTATYVAWNWKANGSGSSNTDGNMAETVTVSANTDAGFSIVTYTGDGSAATIGHGLSKSPEMIIIKNRDDSANWPIYHHKNTSAPETDYLKLDTTAATADNSTFWNDTAPTSSVFTVATDGDVNTDDDKYVAYCFHSVDGYSKVGSYTGNGNADGTFVYTGFRPAFLLMKVTNTASDWHIVDSVRDVDNVIQNTLDPNTTAVEGSGSDRFDFTSNGFKLRQTSGSYNGNNSTYIYMAFAETPFKYSNAR